MVTGARPATMVAAAGGGARWGAGQRGKEEEGVVQEDRELTTRAMAWSVGPRNGNGAGLGGLGRTKSMPISMNSFIAHPRKYPWVTYGIHAHTCWISNYLWISRSMNNQNIVHNNMYMATSIMKIKGHITQ